VKKADIDALLHAHRRNARAVAFLHVLRQASLDPDDHAFLEQHAAELASADLLRWRARTPPTGRPPILVAMAQMAADKPVEFEHEVLNAPGLSFDDREWATLADLCAGKVPAHLFARIERKDAGAPAPAALFPPPDASFGEGDGGSLFGGESLGDALGLDLDDDATDGPLFADPFVGLSVEEGLDKVMLSTVSGDERAMLLDWLEGKGVAREEVLDAALCALQKGPFPSAVAMWLARKLDTPEAWQKLGRPLFSVLIRRREFGDMQSILAEDRGEAITEAERAVLGETLLELARGALRKNTQDLSMAAAMLAALSTIDVTPELRRRFGPLKQAVNRAGGAPPLVALVDLCVHFARSGPRGSALESMVSAVHVLADALG